MSKEQWEKLINLPNEYEVDPSIAQRAIEEIKQKQAKPKKNWFIRRWKYLASCAALAVAALCFIIPLLNKTPATKIVYYEEYEVTYEVVDNPVAFVAEGKLNICYFEEAATITTKSATITATNEFAFLKQETLHIGDLGFDKVDLRAVVKENAEFDFYDTYKVLTDNIKISDIIVNYQIFENTANSNRNILAKFSYQKVDYYLEIVTEEDGVKQLEKYVTMLLGQN